MLRLIGFILVLMASIWAGVEMMHHPGYLLLVFQPWMVQMPIWFALLAFIIFLVLFYILIDSWDRLCFLGFRIQNWFRFRHEHESFSKTQQGLSALIEGRWKKSEQLLIAGVNPKVEPLMNYLGAAKAAHEQGAFDRRDAYIQKAYKVAPRADIAIGLTQSELEVELDQLEQAQATLNHLRQKDPKHPRVLKLLEKVYVRKGDWQNLLLIIPALRKSKAISNEQAEIFEKNIYCEMLHKASNQPLEEVQKIWNSIPRYFRKNPDVVTAYVQQLVRFSTSSKEVEELIRKVLKIEYQPVLVNLYSKLPFTNLNRQLVIVGAWLKTYGQRPELLLALARLCVRVQLWGKAKDYFDKCLKIGPNIEASLEYGKLLERLEEPEAAMLKYREGLAMQTPDHGSTMQLKLLQQNDKNINDLGE